MNALTIELDKRLAALPDADPDFYRCTLQFIEELGLVKETLSMLDCNPDASIEDVIMFREVYVGDVEVYGEDGARAPVDVSRLRLTSGMCGILADMKGKTLKSYQYEPAGSDGDVADCNVRLNLGQHAVDLNCYGFSFDLGGVAAELGALHCERMSLLDDFRAWSEGPVRTRLVGERITGVELVTERVELDGEQALDIDVAVAVRTAHSLYTFARESWASTGIRVVVAGELSVPPSVAEHDKEWLRVHPELGAAKVARTTVKLA